MVLRRQREECQEWLLVARPFNIAYQEDKLSDVAKDFIDFIFSKQGQDIVTQAKNVPVEENPAEYSNSNKLSGKIIIQGSTSVAPVMEKIAEGYKAVQPDVAIEQTGNGSRCWHLATIEGKCGYPRHGLSRTQG